MLVGAQKITAPKASTPASQSISRALVALCLSFDDGDDAQAVQGALWATFSWQQARQGSGVA